MEVNTWSVSGENFTLEARYRVLGFLGSGTYGAVCEADDLRENIRVAIKKMKDIFSSTNLAKRTLRELRLLRLIDHRNVIKTKALLRPHNRDFSDIYLVFEVMETDLGEVIRSGQIFSDQHVQFISYQLLHALRYLHESNIVHRDLK